MEIRTYTTEDKTDWPDGPWKDEPDKVQWPDESTGLPCLIVRNDCGAWCGYVGVPDSHPLFGVGYDDAHDRNDAISVHHGLTFASSCQIGRPEAEGVCHVPAPGESDNLSLIHI